MHTCADGVHVSGAGSEVLHDCRQRVGSVLRSGMASAWAAGRPGPCCDSYYALCLPFLSFFGEAARRQSVFVTGLVNDLLSEGLPLLSLFVVPAVVAPMKFGVSYRRVTLICFRVSLIVPQTVELASQVSPSGPPASHWHCWRPALAASSFQPSET